MHFLRDTCMLRYKYFAKNCDVHSKYIHTTCCPVTCCSSVETDLHGHIVWSLSLFVTQVDNVSLSRWSFLSFVVIYWYTLCSISVFAAPAWKNNCITSVLFVQNDYICIIEKFKMIIQVFLTYFWHERKLFLSLSIRNGEQFRNLLLVLPVNDSAEIEGEIIVVYVPKLWFFPLKSWGQLVHS